MAYAALIDAKLALAYRQLKDLAEPVVFIRTEVTAFDFGSAEPTVKAEPDREISAVILEETREKGVKKMQLLFKTVDIPALSGFDQVRIKGEVWTVGPAVHQRRYTTLLGLVSGGENG